VYADCSYAQFFAKIDVDVCFRTRVDVAQTLVERSTDRDAPIHFLHTKLTTDNEACDRTLGGFVQAYTAEHACCANEQTAEYQPTGHLPQVPYSNLIAGWLGFWQSPRVLHFANAWHKWQGGWVHRWTVRPTPAHLPTTNLEASLSTAPCVLIPPHVIH
jgi:hypothetical protein